jgi:acyl dehydratase
MTLYYDDLAIGTRFTSRELLVSLDDVLSFARSFDPQPAHLDPEGAKATFFGEHVASGWHTCALTMRLIYESVPLEGGVIGGGSDELRWPKPLRPGDTIHVETEVAEMRTLKSRPGLGLVRIRTTTLTQRGDAVQTMMPNLFVPIRSPANGG